MRNIQLDWQQGAALTVGLTLVQLAARAASRRRAAASDGGSSTSGTGTAEVAVYLGEAAIIAALYSVWQFAATLSVSHGAGAYSRGRWVLRAEHGWLPSERDVQRLIDGHSLLEQLCNLFYAGVHFAALGIFLVWLFARHRRAYARVRLVIVLVTLSCLLIELIPVAPPRLLPNSGFVDTAAVHGQSVYQISGITTDQLSAMPSLHVGWALIVAWGAITVSSSRWRWLVLAHPVLTVFVVVATANHYWLDGIVAGVLLLASIGLTVPWRGRPGAAENQPAIAASVTATAGGSR